MIKRNDLWCMQYRTDRYMEELTEDEIIERGKDIMANYLTLNDNKKLGLVPLDKGGEYWIISWTHIMEERALRKYTYPQPFAYNLSDLQVPKHDWTGIENAIKTFKAKNLRMEHFL